MRLRNLVLAACAAIGLAMPAQAQLTLEWHFVSLNAPANAAATNVPARTNPAIAPTELTGAGALLPGSTIMLQLMLRDNNATGMTFPWSFGDGVQSPPNSNINGVGVLAWGAVVNSTNGAVFGPTGGPSFNNNRAVPTINSELNGPFVTPPATGYPAPPGDFTVGTTGVVYNPYSATFSAFSASSARVDTITDLLSVGSPFENGDFPRQRPGTTAFLMPLFNMRFTATSAGTVTLNLADPNAGAADWLVTGASGAVLPGGDMLDAGLFSTYVPLTIEVVPEPTSMALVGMALAGLGYRKLRRNKKTTEVAA